MAVNIQYEDPIGRLFEKLPGILLEKRRTDIAAREAEDLRAHREAIVGIDRQEAIDVKAHRESEQERLRQEATDLALFRKNSLELEAHKEMMDLVETMAPEAQLAVIKNQFATNPQYMSGGQTVINSLTTQVSNIQSDRTNFAKGNSQLQNKNISGAANTLKDIKDPTLASNLSTAINAARKTQYEVSRPELSRGQQVAKMKLDLISERLELELDAREYNISGLLIDPYSEVAQSIAELRAQYKTAYDEFTASLTAPPVTPPVVTQTTGGVPPPVVVTPTITPPVTPPVITPTRQYSFMVTSGKTGGVLGDYSIEIIGPAGNSMVVEARFVDKILEGKADRKNYLGRMKNLFGVDKADATKLLSKAYSSRKGEVGELQGGIISARSASVVVGSDLTPEDEEALNDVLQQYVE